MKKTENTKRIDKRNLRKLTAFMAALMLVLLLVPQRTVKAERAEAAVGGSAFHKEDQRRTLGKFQVKRKANPLSPN